MGSEGTLNKFQAIPLKNIHMVIPKFKQVYIQALHSDDDLTSMTTIFEPARGVEGRKINTFKSDIIKAWKPIRKKKLRAKVHSSLQSFKHSSLRPYQLKTEVSETQGHASVETKTRIFTPIDWRLRPD
jgi:hypothetical protein